MRFFSFHLMPYPALPKEYDGPAWVTCPNPAGAGLAVVGGTVVVGASVVVVVDSVVVVVGFTTAATRAGLPEQLVATSARAAVSSVKDWGSRRTDASITPLRPTSMEQGSRKARIPAGGQPQWSESTVPSCASSAST